MMYLRMITFENSKRKKMLKYIQIGILKYLVAKGTDLNLLEMGFVKDTTKQLNKTIQIIDFLGIQTFTNYIVFIC